MGLNDFHLKAKNTNYHLYKHAVYHQAIHHYHTIQTNIKSPKNYKYIKYQPTPSIKEQINNNLNQLRLIPLTQKQSRNLLSKNICIKRMKTNYSKSAIQYNIKNNNHTKKTPRKIC